MPMESSSFFGWPCNPLPSLQTRRRHSGCPSVSPPAQQTLMCSEEDVSAQSSQPRARLSCSHAHTACDFQADLPGDEKIRGCWRREANAAHAAPSLATSGIELLPAWVEARLPLKWEVMIRQGPGSSSV